MIKNEDIISVHYTGKLQDGEVFDSSEGRDPLEFKVGSGQIIKGFEDAILGKEIGDKIVVNVPSSEAYGPSRDDLIITVDKSQMPGEVEVGQSLQASADDGQQINVIIKEITEDSVIIDGNHPLAGMDLTFEIDIVSIK